jgi:hypothetical protein
MNKNKQDTVALIVLIACISVLAFVIGSNLESARVHRRECVRLGGFPEGMFMEDCYFEGEYNTNIKEQLDRTCYSGKGWYIYNDSKTYWRHKCG